MVMTLTVGRTVWVRMCSTWSRGVVIFVTGRDVVVDTVCGHRVNIHSSVYRRDLRATSPRG